MHLEDKVRFIFSGPNRFYAILKNFLLSSQRKIVYDTILLQIFISSFYVSMRFEFDSAHFVILFYLCWFENLGDLFNQFDKILYVTVYIFQRGFVIIASTRHIRVLFKFVCQTFGLRFLCKRSNSLVLIIT